MKERLTALEYQKEREESDFLKDLRAQRARDLQDSTTYQEDRKRACPICHIIRAPYEVALDTCDSCNYVRRVI